MPFLNPSEGSGGGYTEQDLTPGSPTNTFSTSTPFTEAKIWVGGVLQYPSGPGNLGGITLTGGPPYTGFQTSYTIDGTLESVFIQYK